MKKITKVYEGHTFDELDDTAKDRVRQWFAEGLCDFHEVVYEDFKGIADLMGITVKNIYFSGFSSQGDGAMFEGNYSYKKQSVKAIKDYAPNDQQLHEIATTLQKLQKKYFYSLSANIAHYGYYYHSRCNTITVENCYTWQEIDHDTESDLAECLRDLMDWLYKQLEKEYDYQLSEEVISESCEANEYYFTKKGEII